MPNTFRLTLFLVFLSFSHSAFSYSESKCWDQDCKTKGWTESRNGFESDFKCIRDNCLTNGWVTGLFETSTYISCKNANCLQDGYYQIERSTQRLISQTICHENDCATKGSTTYSSNEVKVLTCIDENCFHSGWSASINGSIAEDTACLNGDCLKFGWINYK